MSAPAARYDEAAGVLLADLEHVFRVPRNPVRLPLQNSNVSRIFQTLGASIDDLPILWVAAPLTGLLVQPIIGYYSDRTWNWLGRRRPYFLAGALLASLALVAMPRSPVLWIAAGMLWVLDASINIAMEPFRAFVGDQLPEQQRPAGYAMQSFFIGVGAVIASMLPWIFAQAGVSNVGTGSGAARFPTRCAIRSTSAPPCWRAQCCGRSSRRANIRPASCTDSPMPRRLPKA